MSRMSYADALMLAGARKPGTVRDDVANAQAGTPNGGTPEDMATRLMQAGRPSEAVLSAVTPGSGSSVSDGGRRGVANPEYSQPPQGVPSDARQQGDPMAQAHAALIAELGPEAGEAAFKLLLQHAG